jgi:hypothetical protein
MNQENRKLGKGIEPKGKSADDHLDGANPISPKTNPQIL